MASLGALIYGEKMVFLICGGRLLEKNYLFG